MATIFRRRFPTIRLDYVVRRLDAGFYKKKLSCASSVDTNNDDRWMPDYTNIQQPNPMVLVNQEADNINQRRRQTLWVEWGMLSLDLFFPVTSDNMNRRSQVHPSVPYEVSPVKCDAFFAPICADATAAVAKTTAAAARLIVHRTHKPLTEDYSLRSVFAGVGSD